MAEHGQKQSIMATSLSVIGSRAVRSDENTKCGTIYFLLMWYTVCVGSPVIIMLQNHKQVHGILEMIEIKIVKQGMLPSAID